MRIPKHWAKGSFIGIDARGDPLKFDAWGWSDLSLHDAEIKGTERARLAFFSKFSRGSGRRTDSYDVYLNVPLREEIVEHLLSLKCESGIITRNRYGALVLNTPRVLFVDVDLPYIHPQGFVARLKWVLSREYREARLRKKRLQVVDCILAWSSSNPQYTFRLYQTFAGFRLLFLNRCFDPNSSEVENIFKELRCDRLYSLLTRRQECFRARLTPKPWRIGIAEKYIGFSSLDPGLDDLRSDWIRKYEEAARAYDVCALVETLGSGEIGNDEIALIVDTHDRYTGINGRALA